MAKLTLQSIVSGFLSATRLNTNNSLIETAIENTLSRDGTGPNAMAAQLDMGSNRIINLGAPIDAADAVRLIDLGGSGGGGAVEVDWSIITNKPTEYPAEDHVHSTSEVTGLDAALASKSDTGHTHTTSNITDYASATLQKIKDSLSSGTGVTLDKSGSTVVITASGGGGAAADGTLGSPDTSPNFIEVFGGNGDGVTSNDTAFGLAEADTSCNRVWLPKGVYKTALLYASLKKHYWGPGQILTGDPGSGGLNYKLPGRFTYADALPTGHYDQGTSGWFGGDHTFGDPEWHILGPNARTYHTAQRYFQSQLTPRNNWIDIHSGNSGGQAFMSSGAAAGSTVITIHATPITDWIGKQVGFAQVANIGGDPILYALEWHTVTAINAGAKTITIDAPLTNTYVWNPANNQAACLGFSNSRTMTTNEYIKVTQHPTAGGDTYGSVVRMAQNYVPKPSETHVFMAGTAGQYGGDITFGANGTLCTGWESQYVDQGFSVAAIGHVDSYNRTNDDCPAGSGRQWLGMRQQSAGTRPIDSAYVWAGYARTGIDLAQGLFMDSAKLTVGTSAGATSLSVDSVNGAVAGDQITIGSYTGVMTAVGTSSVTISPAMNATYGVGTIVNYTQGGSAINLAFGQKIIFNSSTSQSGRGGDPLGVFGPLWSNTRGDIQMETANDGISDYWAIRFNGTGHSAASARIRLRPTVCQISVDLTTAGKLQAQGGFVLSGDTGIGNGFPTMIFGNANQRIVFNTTLNRFEFYKNGTIATTI